MSVELIIGLVSGSVAIIAAVIGLIGRREETSAASTATLVEGQSRRITSLEDRLDKLEKRLEETQTELWFFKAHADALRTALKRAIAWIADAVEWMNGDRREEPPTPPDSEAWADLIASVKGKD